MKYNSLETTAEQVLCFPAKLLDSLGKFEGVSTDIRKYLPVFDKKNHTYVLRSKAEQDPSWKQLIPYCVLRFGGHVFCYQRTPKGGESRLHGKYSLGVGGHINPGDIDYEESVARELDEEIDGLTAYRNNVVGMLYSEADSVSCVHFGVVHRLTLNDRNITPKASALTAGAFRDILWLKANADKFENWSQLVIGNLL